MKKKELLQLILDLQARIDRLEKQLNKIDNRTYPLEKIGSPPFNPFSNPGIINVPFITTDECLHEYPMPWHATVPPPCKKCGKISEPYTVITCDGTGNTTQTTGYIKTT